MKFRITFKDPDGVSDSVNEAALSLADANTCTVVPV